MHESINCRKSYKGQAVGKIPQAAAHCKRSDCNIRFPGRGSWCHYFTGWFPRKPGSPVTNHPPGNPGVPGIVISCRCRNAAKNSPYSRGSRYIGSIFALGKLFADGPLGKKRPGKGPLFIDIQKQAKGRTIPESGHLRHGWMDELAYVISLQNSSVQNISAQPIQLQNQLIGIHLMLRFDNSDVATIRYLGISDSGRHERLIQSGNSMFICDVLAQKSTRYTKSTEGMLLNAGHQRFDASTTAEISLDSFFRSIKSGKPGGFSSAQALQTARLAGQVDEIIARV